LAQINVILFLTLRHNLFKLPLEKSGTV